MSGISDRLGIEFITALGLDPASFVHLAADLGLPRVGLSLAPIAMVPEDAPRWSLREDKALFDATCSALRERHVEILVGEAFLLHPQMDVAGCGADLDLFAELGARRINVVGLEPDEPRSHDQFARLAAMARTRGMGTCIEFMPGVAINSMAKALACVEASGDPEAGLLLDAMHFFAAGTTIAELAQVPLSRIAHAQLCDTILASPIPYMDRAKFERLAPGKGDLPLADFVKALPPQVPLGLEIPQRAEALAGMEHRTRIVALIAATEQFATDLL